MMCCLGVLGAVATANANGRTFFLSGNYALTDNRLSHNFTTHEVDAFGISFGLMLPITHHRFAISYKGAAAFHGVTDVEYGATPGPDDDRFYRNLDQYIGSLNGLVVSTRLDVSSSVYVEPMIGVGVLVHIIYGNHGEGIAYGSFQTELSALLMREMARVDVGGFFSVGYVPFGGYFDRMDMAYVTFGVALSIQ
jgi:hypothetical protein